METAFIACEYNPFHNGHMYHISETKRQGADAVICIMSGNFVQRGSIAVMEKHERARCAISAGADLVFELPLKYAVATASLFADGFVKTSLLTGLDGKISFACKTQSDILRDICNLLTDNAAEFAVFKDKGVSYPVAAQNFIELHLGKNHASALKDPNNILALEYLRALKTYGRNTDCICINRIGSEHGSFCPHEEFASAGYIRNIIENERQGCMEKIQRYVPSDTWKILESCVKTGKITDKNIFEKICMSKLLFLDSEEIKQINNVCGGTENRIIESIKASADLEELYSKIKSKRYTHSRIRQIILGAFFEIKKEEYNEPIGYIRVLACNERGREVIKKMKACAEVPVIMNLSQIKNEKNEAITRQAQLDFWSGKIFDMCTEHPIGGNPEYDIPPVIL